MDPLLIALGALVLIMVIGFVVSKIGGTGPDAPTPDDSGPTQHSRGDRPDLEGYPPGSRPGGPGAEAMNVDQPGDPIPGTPTDESATADAVDPSEASRKPLGDE
jgi:hypothetical protein